MTRLTTERALLTSPLLTRAQLEELDSATLADKVIGLRNDIADDAEEIARLRADLLAAHEERDALRTALDGLRAAVATVRDARAVVAATGAASIAAWDAVEALPTASQTEGIAVALRASYEAGDALNAALDALLAGAPPARLGVVAGRWIAGRATDDPTKGP